MAIVTLDDESSEIHCSHTELKETVVLSTASEVINTVLPDRNEYETIEIVNKDKQLDKIVQYIEGEEWQVDYYLQLITKDNEIGRFDPYSPDVSKQYLNLKQMLLYVDSPLTQNEAQELEGSAYINANVTPNQGDVFIATLLGKRQALLRIESIEKKTYNLNNVFYITYKLDMFLDSDDTVMNSLRERVSKTYYYDKDFLLTNSEPILMEETFKHKRQITVSINEVIEYYFNTMFNSEKCILSIPGQDAILIDIMLQEFIFKIINSTDSHYISKISRNTVPDDMLRQTTIWDALLNRDIDMIKTCNRKMINVSTVSFGSNVKLRNISYLGIQYIVYPKSPDLGILTTGSKADGNPYLPIKEVPNSYRENKGIPENLIPVLDVEDEFYVFTEAFYGGDDLDMSTLELATYMYLSQEKIPNKLIVDLIEDYKYWDRVQQFYFIPVLILILRDNIYGTRSVT